ncbi:hypothetical protein [Geodermatophilus chilensis]|uniref:hypothetical protein n=1 Tax=Geodermatophilus chilensis TaxID=2035835 RepID=UPI000C267AD8|nr:hypothetical protein [Geodermatophilus chilensis]
MSDERLAHLRDVGQLLWPSPIEMRITTASPSSNSGDREYLLLPSRHRPRMLVPHGQPRAAAGALRRYGVGRGRTARWAAAFLSTASALGIVPLLARDRVVLHRPDGPTASIEDHLADVLGRELFVSMYLSTARANRKPVLQVLDSRGRTLAYVKVGVDPLTSRLVRDETAALTALAATDLRGLTVPTVLHQGCWNGLELLVQAALPVDNRRRRPSPHEVSSAQIEVAAIGRSEATALAGTAYWSALTQRIGRMPETPAGERLAELTHHLAEGMGDVALPLGAWHGDWTPWNTARGRGGRLLVWDWERFGSSVPAGFDALHWALQTDLVTRQSDPLLSAQHCTSSAAGLLEPFGLDATQARATAVTYLADLAARYLADRQDAAGARLGDVTTWLLPAISSGLARN